MKYRRDSMSHSLIIAINLHFTRNLMFEFSQACYFRTILDDIKLVFPCVYAKAQQLSFRLREKA